MAARGSEAKAAVIKKIENFFGDNWVGTQNNKVYVEEMDKGEKVQIAISFVCTNTPIERENNKTTTEAPSSGEINFDDFDWGTSKPTPKVNEISAEEQQTIEELMKRLGL